MNVQTLEAQPPQKEELFSLNLRNQQERKP